MKSHTDPQPVRWFRYIRHDEALRYLAQGWTLIALQGRDDRFDSYAFVVRWDGEGPPPETHQ